MRGLSVTGALAVTIERESGLPCGRCGGAHANQEGFNEAPCVCACCRDALAAIIGPFVEERHPDLMKCRAGVRIISERDFRELVRRMEAEVEVLRRDMADHDRAGAESHTS